MAKTKTQRHNYTPRKRPNWPVALIPVDATRTAFLRSMANRRFNGQQDAPAPVTEPQVGWI
jgi:hypothetical protein